MDPGRLDRGGLAGARELAGGTSRSDVRLSPTDAGAGVGVVDAGNRAVATATTPITLVPAAGLERSARLTVRRALTAVAVTGLAPTHLAVEFHLPPAVTDDQLRTVVSAFDAEATALDVAIVTGHTARYSGCSFPLVGSTTALAVGDSDDVVRPDGAQPGDRVLLAGRPGAVDAGLLASLLADRLADAVDDTTLAAAREGVDGANGVRAAMLAAAAGPATSLWPTTDAGLAGALVGLARAAGVGVAVDRDAIPVDEAVAAVCAALNVDPLTAAGGLVATVPPDRVEGVERALADEAIRGVTIGTVEPGDGVSVDGHRLDPPVDPLWTSLAMAEAEAEARE